jgi:hypothetical protein
MIYCSVSIQPVFGYECELTGLTGPAIAIQFGELILQALYNGLC